MQFKYLIITTILSFISLSAWSNNKLTQQELENIMGKAAARGREPPVSELAKEKRNIERAPSANPKANYAFWLKDPAFPMKKILLVASHHGFLLEKLPPAIYQAMKEMKNLIIEGPLKSSWSDDKIFQEALKNVKKLFFLKINNKFYPFDQIATASVIEKPILYNAKPWTDALSGDYAEQIDFLNKNLSSLLNKKSLSHMNPMVAAIYLEAFYALKLLSRASIDTNIVRFFQAKGVKPFYLETIESIRNDLKQPGFLRREFNKNDLADLTEGIKSIVITFNRSENLDKLSASQIHDELFASDPLYKAFTRRGLDGVEELIEDHPSILEGLYIKERNALWVPKIPAFLASAEGSFLIVVGAAHVLDLLKRLVVLKFSIRDFEQGSFPGQQ